MFRISSSIDRGHGCGLETIDSDLPINADSPKGACLQYIIECGYGDGTFTEIADIGTENTPCIRYCVQGEAYKLFVYVVPQNR